MLFVALAVTVAAVLILADNHDYNYIDPYIPWYDYYSSYEGEVYHFGYDNPYPEDEGYFDVYEEAPYYPQYDHGYYNH